MIHLVGSVLIIAAMGLLLGATGLYGLGFRWWRDPTGRHLFAFMAVFCMAILLWGGRVVATGAWQAIGEPGSWPIIRLVMFALIDWVLAWRLLIIVRAFPAERRRRKEQKR